MKPNVLGALLAACALFWPVSPSMAHHSFAAEFDSNKPVTLTGTITKVEFQNPHIYFYIDVKQADGRVANYAVEGGTPNQLRRQGWGRAAMQRLCSDVFPKDCPIYIDAAVGNKAAIAFWHAIGFQDYSIGMGLKAGAAPK